MLKNSSHFVTKYLEFILQSNQIVDAYNKNNALNINITPLMHYMYVLKLK